MYRTRKYFSALETLNRTSGKSSDLYRELKELGYCWVSQESEWKRNNEVPNNSLKTVKLTLECDSKKLKFIASFCIQRMEEGGYSYLYKESVYRGKGCGSNASVVLVFLTDDTDEVSSDNFLEKVARSQIKRD